MVTEGNYLSILHNYIHKLYVLWVHIRCASSMHSIVHTILVVDSHSKSLAEAHIMTAYILCFMAK